MFIWLFIVPILAKIAQSIGGEATLTVFGHPFVVHLELPFSWVAFYFSALSFAVGNLICRLWCPKIITDQENFAGFRDRECGMMEIERYAFEVDMNLEGLRRDVEARDRHIEAVADIHFEKSAASAQRDFFFAVQERADAARASARFSALSFYAVGAILLVGVLLENTLFVGRFIFQ